MPGSQNNTVTIDLLGIYHVSFLDLEVDNNDVYDIQWHDFVTDTWNTFAHAGPNNVGVGCCTMLHALR